VARFWPTIRIWAFPRPRYWYLARIELASGGVIGATIPGIPVIMAGRSERLGWGLTSSYLDDQDLFIEQLNPDNPGEYRTPEGSSLSRPRVDHRIKDGPDHADPALDRKRPGAARHALRAGHDHAAGPCRLAGLDRAFGRGHLDECGHGADGRRLRDEALDAGRFFVAPSQNLTLVDARRIAMKLIGAMPRRDPATKPRAACPAPAGAPRTAGRAMIPYSPTPNSSPAGRDRGQHQQQDRRPPFPEACQLQLGRHAAGLRWQRLMQGREVHTRDSFIEAQLDTVSFTARSLLPLIGRDLWFTGEAAPEGTPERQRQRALDLLSDWNGEMNEHLPEPLIYAAWLRPAGPADPR
jgi:penicillin amidase